MTTYTLTAIDVVPGSFTYVQGLNDSGQIVGGYRDPISGFVNGFVWQNGIYTTHNYNFNFQYLSINDAGDTVGIPSLVRQSEINPLGGEIISLYGAPWTYSPTYQVIATTVPGGINDNGQVVGSTVGEQTVGFVLQYNYWSSVQDDPNSWTMLAGPEGATSVYAEGINDSGDVVGAYTDTSGHTHGFLYSNGFYQTIDAPYAANTYLVGINNDDDIIGMSYDENSSTWQNFVYSNGSFELFDDVSGSFVFITGINDSDQITGYYNDENSITRGFLAVPTTVAPPIIILGQSHVSGAITELPATTGDSSVRVVAGSVAFSDQNTGDRPLASVRAQSIEYRDAQDNVRTLSASLEALFKNSFLIVPEPGNTNNGVIHWGFTIADESLDFLGAGEKITVTSTVEIDDGNGGIAFQDVIVTIDGANDRPIAAADLVVVQKGKAVAFGSVNGVLANDSEYDNADTLHVSAVNGSSANVGMPIAGSYGTLTLNSDGSFDYLANKTIPTLSALGGVRDQFVYSISDEYGGQSTSVLAVTVQTQQALNRAPVLSISALDASKSEGNSGTTPFTFVITREGNSDTVTTVNWNVEYGKKWTADRGDFVGGDFPSGSETFERGELSKVVTINISADSLHESNGRMEEFVVRLSNQSNGATLKASKDSATGQILNDDAGLGTSQISPPFTDTGAFAVTQGFTQGSTDESHKGKLAYSVDLYPLAPVVTETPVLAAMTGQVVHVQRDVPDGEAGISGLGNLVTVRYDDPAASQSFYMSYLHLKGGSQIPVSVGELVNPGDPIGYIGNAGYGLHLHVQFGWNLTRFNSGDWVADASKNSNDPSPVMMFSGYTPSGEPEPGFYSLSTIDLTAQSYGANSDGRHNAFLFGTDDANIIGDTFKNTIVGNAGANHLTGGGGNDTFVFEVGFGNDVITDFSQTRGNRDKIDLTAFDFADFSELMSHASATGFDGSDTWIQVTATDSITLQHVALDSLLARDFLL